jgi:NIPSNAP
VLGLLECGGRYRKDTENFDHLRRFDLPRQTGLLSGKDVFSPTILQKSSPSHQIDKSIEERMIRRALSLSGRRLLSTSVSSKTAVAASANRPIVELREYAIHPQHVADYRALTLQSSDLRMSLLPLRLFSLPETGGSLHTSTHAYYYAGGHAERDSKRLLASHNDAWQAYVASVLPAMASQSSSIWMEAHFSGAASQVIPYGLAATTTPSDNTAASSRSILEFRRYQLKLGYDTVPQFLTLYNTGLPSKLHAPGMPPSTSLVTVLYSDVGRLNQVLEIWRHDDTHAMDASRAAARQAQEWQRAIADIANLALDFTTVIHKPEPFSPIR